MQFDLLKPPAAPRRPLPVRGPERKPTPPAPTPKPAPADPAAAYHAATLVCLKLYVPGHPTPEWQAACEEAAALYKASRRRK